MKNVTSGAGRTEMQFWEQWWTSVVQKIGVYPNAILEMWNEPGDNQSPYFSYMIDMYQTIRSLGCQNLIFMQWNPGLVPTVSELKLGSASVQSTKQRHRFTASQRRLHNPSLQVLALPEHAVDNNL